MSKNFNNKIRKKRRNLNCSRRNTVEEKDDVEEEQKKANVWRKIKC